MVFDTNPPLAINLPNEKASSYNPDDMIHEAFRSAELGCLLIASVKVSGSGREGETSRLTLNRGE